MAFQYNQYYLAMLFGRISSKLQAPAEVLGLFNAASQSQGPFSTVKQMEHKITWP